MLVVLWQEATGRREEASLPSDARRGYNKPMKLKHLVAVIAIGGAMTWAAWPEMSLPAHTLPPAGWGSTNPLVTQTTIGETICNPKWRTGSIRPTSSYTSKLKLLQLGYFPGSTDKNGQPQIEFSGTTTVLLYTPFGSYSDPNPSHYEEDHLISLELGGAPSDPMNLWPQPYTNDVGGQNLGARDKDRVEGWLHREVCAGRKTLAEAQREISTNWVAAYAEMKGVKYEGGSSDTDD